MLSQPFPILSPRIRHIANLWTLMGHPLRESEWSLESKLRNIRNAGFDGVCWAPSKELHEKCKQFDLLFIGGMASSDQTEFPKLCRELKEHGAKHVNVQLGTGDTMTAKALELTLALMAEAKAWGLLPAVESHRGTCTETPEKLYMLAESFETITGDKLPISWDFSHFAVVKHLLPGEFAQRLLVRPDLISNAQQFHLRPFNGHHAQVPITYRDGGLTEEVLDWIPFAETLLSCWWRYNKETNRDIFVCPELGPREGGYALSTFPNSWEDAKILRALIQTIWSRVIADS